MILDSIEHGEAGGEKIELFATLKNPRVRPPWGDVSAWVIRGSAEAALHTARIWGGDACAVRCWLIEWSDGREHRTPWVIIEQDDG